MSIDFPRPSIPEPYGNFDNTVSRDFLDAMCDREIGHGMSRVVFSLRHAPDKVVKIESYAHFHYNVLEGSVWGDLSDTPLAKWLAPVHYLSACGSVMVQSRTTPPPPTYKWPEKIPIFFTDTKKGNFGLIGRKLVCHDYAINRMDRYGASMRMVKAEWWNES